MISTRVAQETSAKMPKRKEDPDTSELMQQVTHSFLLLLLEEEALCSLLFHPPFCPPSPSACLPDADQSKRMPDDADADYH